MTLISYMSVPVTTKSGAVKYIKVDFASNQLKIKCNDGEYHVSEDFHELAEDVDMYENDSDSDDNNNTDDNFTFDTAQTSALTLLQKCAEEFSKMQANLQAS